jgi:hypothetical protein
VDAFPAAFSDSFRDKMVNPDSGAGEEFKKYGVIAITQKSQ